MVFDRYDHDENGVMDSAELEHLWRDTVNAMPHLSQSLKSEMVAQAVLRSRKAFDRNGDGLVQKEEFVNYAENMGQGLETWLRREYGAGP